MKKYNKMAQGKLDLFFEIMYTGIEIITLQRNINLFVLTIAAFLLADIRNIN